MPSLNHTASAPSTADLSPSPTLLALLARKPPPDPMLVAGYETGETATRSATASGETGLVVDLALRMGWSKRIRELNAVGCDAAAALGDGRITEGDYTVLREAQSRRQGDIHRAGELHQLRYGAPRRPLYDHDQARRGRTDKIALGLLPPSIRHLLTPGEIAVATTYAEDFMSKGFTDDAKAFLANRSRTCERVAQRAQSQLVEHGIIKITKRTRRGRRGYSTIVEIIDPIWLLWLRNRRRPRVQKGDWPVCEHVRRDLKQPNRPQRRPSGQEKVGIRDGVGSRARPPDP